MVNKVFVVKQVHRVLLARKVMQGLLELMEGMDLVF
jgi:hypothetical protein